MGGRPLWSGNDCGDRLSVGGSSFLCCCFHIAAFMLALLLFMKWPFLVATKRINKRVCLSVRAAVMLSVKLLVF